MSENSWGISEILLPALLIFTLSCSGDSHSQECSDNESCSSAEYCKFQIGQCSGKGVCSERPDICIEIFSPVCGCDEKTYPNSCYAEREGVAIKAEGECGKKGLVD